MWSILGKGPRLCDGLTRREWLCVGGLSAFGLSLPALLGARSSQTAGATTGKAKSCIVLFHLGGPPQHETWDPKPDAAPEIRGEFKPAATSVTGVQVGELMPRTARLMDKICILRGMSTDDNAHSSSGYWMLTGVPHQPTNSENAKPGAPNDWPCTAAVVQRLRPGDGGLPASVVIPEHIWNTGNVVWPGQDGGMLGRSADPWSILCDPNSPDFQVPGLAPPADVPPLRLRDRLSLLEQVNKGLDAVERGPAIERFDVRSRQAFDLLHAGRAREAFNLDKETPVQRDRYGRNRWGQSLLLARRLVESGVSLVQVNWTRAADDTTDSPAWDTHAKNAVRCKTALMPKMDLAYSALLEDLDDRGLLDETLVVWMGEFGRSPKINGGGGRDHWGHVFSVALAGGGVRGGQAYGSSDAIGGHPRDGRVQPQDLTATIYHCLGFPTHTEIHDGLGRPLPLSRGEVIRAAVGAAPPAVVPHVEGVPRMREKPMTPAAEGPARRAATGLAGRAAAVAEVLLAFAIVHVSYRAFKHFTPLGRAEGAFGLNYSVGATMILFTACVLLLCGRRFADYGLTLKDWRSHLNMGLFWTIVLILAVAAVVGLSAIRIDPMHAPDPTKAAAAAVGYVAAAVVLVLCFRRLDGWLRRIGLAVGAPLFAALLLLPLAVAAYAGRPLLPVLFQVLWLFFGAGFGEEIFFRGYIQSRVDQAFGRPWRFLGLEFGPGLLLSSLLFGFIHALNTVDYFDGRFEFAWLWCVTNFCSGLFFGCLREKAKSVFPGAILHGLGDVLATIPALLP